MRYKGAHVPDDSPACGVRKMDRGRNRGLWCAFVVLPDSSFFYSDPCDTKAEAEMELDRIIVNDGPLRVYV
jgi:hypothetical protein